MEESAAAAAVLRLIWGTHMARAVHVMAKLGVADLLADAPLTAAQLAQATQAHEPSLYRVLRLLASLGVLTEHDRRSFGLTILGERLRAGVPASMRSWAMLEECAGGLRSREPIIETVLTGKPGLDIAYRRGVFEHLAAHPALAQQFQAAMSALSGPPAALRITAMHPAPLARRPGQASAGTPRVSGRRSRPGPLAWGSHGGRLSAEDPPVCGR